MWRKKIAAVTVSLCFMTCLVKASESESMWTKFDELINKEEIIEAYITIDGENYIRENIDDIKLLLAEFGSMPMTSFTSENTPEEEFYSPMIVMYTEDAVYKMTPYGRLAYGSYGKNMLYYDRVESGNKTYQAGEEHRRKYEDVTDYARELPQKQVKDCLILPNDEWAVPEIKAAADANTMPYSLAGDYTKNITRMEFCALAGQAVAMRYASETGQPVSSEYCGVYLRDILENLSVEIQRPTFNDVDMLDNEIEFLFSTGIVQGRGDGDFGADDNITREEMAKIMSGIYGTFMLVEAAGKADYTDADEISDWAIPYVSICRQYDIMEGVGNGAFSPKSLCTREQAIIAMYRMIEKIYM